MSNIRNEISCHLCNVPIVSLKYKVSYDKLNENGDVVFDSHEFYLCEACFCRDYREMLSKRRGLQAETEVIL